MLIRNFDELAKNKLRREALEVVNAGLEAIQAERVMRERVRLDGDELVVKDRRYDLGDYTKVYVVGMGKVAGAVAEELDKILGKRIEKGLVLSTENESFGAIECGKCTHPIPMKENVVRTKKMLELLNQAEPDDVVIVVITGGGSAMMCYPYEMSCGVLAQMTQELMKAGAGIEEMNTIRKHLSQVKGGWLVKQANGAKMVAMIFSDVPGDDLSVIASGPTVLDKTTVVDARKILEKYRVLEKCGIDDCQLQETPKNEVLFERVDNILMLNNAHAVEAMAEKAGELGYQVMKKDEFVQGEAREVGRKLVGGLKENTAVVMGGETTVKVVGSGKGGRNQELVLGAVERIGDKEVVVAVASDGVDLTDYAGAVGDSLTRKMAKEKGVDVDEFVENNDASNFWKQVGGGISTGRLDSNVADLMVGLKE